MGYRSRLVFTTQNRLWRTPMLDLPLTFLNRPAAAGTARPWLLVLMHGVGSNEQDLFGLAPYIAPQFAVLSLRAPYTLGPGAFSWFDFAIEPGGGRRIDAAEEAASRAQLAEVLQSASQQLGIPPERVVVGGFSQGGIMALSLLLTRPELMDAAMVWHSRMLEQVVAAHSATASALQGKKLWLSHGTHDDVIPLAQAQAIARHVQALPVALTYREFAGAHELPQDELVATLEWLQALSTETAGS